MEVLSLLTPDLLPQARVLARSLAEHAGLQLTAVWVALSDPPAQEPFPLISAADAIPGLDLDGALTHHDPEALLPRLLPRLLAERSRLHGEGVLHLPPSAWVLADLEPLENLLSEAAVVLFPRATADPPQDGLEPRRERLDEIGRISTTMMAVGSSADAAGFLAWWEQRLTGVLGPLSGPRGAAPGEDRRWLARYIELAPSRFEAAVIDDPGLSLSMWTLDRHDIAPDGTLDGAGVPRIIDLDGYAPDRPWRLSILAERIRLMHRPALRALLDRYGGELVEGGWTDVEHRRDIGRSLGDGVVFDERLSRLYREALARGVIAGDPFAGEARDAFLEWVRGPAPVGARHGISRYLYRVYTERPDIPTAYPNLDGPDGEQFTGWCWGFGQREMAIPAAFLPPAPAWIDLPDPRALDIGVRVTGYLGHALGLGSAARGYVTALQAADVPVSTAPVAVNEDAFAPAVDRDYGRLQYRAQSAPAEHAFEIVAVNHDELPALVDRLGPGYFRGPRIGIWAWETDRVPERWASAFELVDEVWVNSRYMAENIGRATRVPVLAFPPAASVPERVTPTRLGLPEGFLFLFTFDYMSTVQRKNPVGLVRAFQRAFAPGEGPQLLIKTLNAPRRPLAEDELLWARENRSDIHIVDRSLSGEELHGLIAGCDCYVSLHRAEGYGLSLVEAMAMGKPVIATGFSGNLDFMSPFNSLLVDYTLTRVGGEVEIYPADGRWAEPSVEHAASLMRRVVLDASYARGVGERAARDIAERLSPRACGLAMRSRLERLALARAELERLARG